MFLAPPILLIMQQRKSKVSGNKSDCPFMFLLLLCNHLMAQIRFQLFFIFYSSSAALTSAVMSQEQNNVVLNQIEKIMHGKVCLLKLCACPWISMTKHHILKLKLSRYLVFSFSLLIISAFVWWPNYFRICDENKTIGYIFMLSLLLPLLLQSGILPLVCAKSKFFSDIVQQFPSSDKETLVTAWDFFLCYLVCRKLNTVSKRQRPGCLT